MTYNYTQTAQAQIGIELCDDEMDQGQQQHSFVIVEDGCVHQGFGNPSHHLAVPPAAQNQILHSIDSSVDLEQPSENEQEFMAAALPQQVTNIDDDCITGLV